MVDDTAIAVRRAAIVAPADLGELQVLAQVLLERRRRKDVRGFLTTMTTAESAEQKRTTITRQC